MLLINPQPLAESDLPSHCSFKSDTDDELVAGDKRVVISDSSLVFILTLY